MKRDFEARYSAWSKAIATMPPYAKVTAYTKIPEYRAIVDLGLEALPYIQQKIEEDRSLDFVLCEAVVEICGWLRDEFPITDMGARRNAVLEKLRATGGPAKAKRE